MKNFLCIYKSLCVYYGKYSILNCISYFYACHSIEPDHEKICPWHKQMRHTQISQCLHFDQHCSCSLPWESNSYTTSWVKIFGIFHEFIILRLTFHRKCWIRQIIIASYLFSVYLKTIGHLNLKLLIFWWYRIFKVHGFGNFELSPAYQQHSIFQVLLVSLAEQLGLSLT